MQHLVDAVDLAVDRSPREAKVRFSSPVKPEKSGPEETLSPKNTGSERPIFTRVKQTSTYLPIDPEGFDEGRSLHERDVIRAHDVFERVISPEFADSDIDRQTRILEIGVLYRDRIPGEINFQDVFEVVEDDAFHTKPRTPERCRRNIGREGDRRVLIDLVVIRFDGVPAP
jgi:hypothetical protein